MVFGHVLQGQEVVTQIENQAVDEKSRPINDVKVSNCGELIPKAKAKGKVQVPLDDASMVTSFVFYWTESFQLKWVEFASMVIF